MTTGWRDKKEGKSNTEIFNVGFRKMTVLSMKITGKEKGKFRRKGVSSFRHSDCEVAVGHPLGGE